ncbi:MAG: hypothetical protein JWQ83_2075, partial [Lacunisphaera sp.]|nr:hypothetical protein [Lacunisphaera sp.]
MHESTYPPLIPGGRLVNPAGTAREAAAAPALVAATAVRDPGTWARVHRARAVDVVAVAHQGRGGLIPVINTPRHPIGMAVSARRQNRAEAAVWKTACRARCLRQGVPPLG